MAAPSCNFRINIVGFLECNNGRTCDMHPYGCGNIMVLEHPDNGVGMVLCLRMYVQNELAVYMLMRIQMVVMLGSSPGNSLQVPMVKGLMELWSI